MVSRLCPRRLRISKNDSFLMTKAVVPRRNQKFKNQKQKWLRMKLIGSILQQPSSNASNIQTSVTCQSLKKGSLPSSLVNSKRLTSRQRLHTRLAKSAHQQEALFTHFPFRKDKVIRGFLELIYDGRSIIVDDSKDAFRWEIICRLFL